MNWPNAAASLFFVLVLAKLLVVGFASPLLFIQDALVALVFAAAEVALRGRRWIWIPYGILVAWIAVNVPVAIVLGSWLTRPMLEAAGGPLADSIRYYLTAANIVPLALVIGAGAALPFVVQRRKITAVFAATTVLLLGASTAKAKSLEGFQRNAVTALLARSFAGGGVGNHAALRASSLTSTVQADLAFLRGSARGMNLVVVILESTAAQYLGMYGAAEDPMPNLTALSANSVVFDAAYAVYPESVKGLYAALCGRSPKMGAPLSASLDDPCSPLPKSLGAAGFRTALFHSGRFMYLGMDELVARAGFETAEDAGAISGVTRSSFGVDEASTVARTIAWIRNPGDRRPFLAMYLPAAGHHPYATAIPGPFGRDKEFDRYRNALHETDVALGELVKALRDPSVGPTALVIFGDHGEAFGQHGGNTGHTLAIWEENVHVPMLISIPGVTRGQMRIASPASVLDVAPTVLDLVAAGTSDAADGLSLLSTKGRKAAAPFFADYSLNWLGVRDGCWKLQYQKEADRAQLFDVCQDPGETADLSGLGKPAENELIERVEQFFAIRIRPRRVAS